MNSVPVLAACSGRRYLLTILCQFDILQFDPGRGSNAIRSTEAPRLHHTSRRRGGLAARGTRAAVGDAGGRFPQQLGAC